MEDGAWEAVWRDEGEGLEGEGPEVGRVARHVERERCMDGF